MVYNIIYRYSKRVSSIRGLSHVLILERKLYPLTGILASRYGQGLHPKNQMTDYHDAIIRHIEVGERVLDLGCGVGHLTYTIATKARARVVAVDRDASQIHMAQKLNPHPSIQYCTGDFTKDIFNGPFDVIVLAGVLGYIYDRIGLLRHLLKTYHPSKILLRVHSIERNWTVPLMQKLEIDYRLDQNHIIEHTETELRQELTAAGLEIREFEMKWGEFRVMALPATR
jgi:2-polyprenyl-3-methyl-5-hydroxy-6-metoxy-1,4-benzoquinol methylase